MARNASAHASSSASAPGSSNAARASGSAPKPACQMVARFDPLLDEVLESCALLGPESLAQPAPLADLLQATHDRLYSRLFQS